MSYRFAQVEVDTARQVVRVEGCEVSCQTRVYQLLLLLCEARGAVVSREAIFARLWEGQPAASDESLTQLVHRLRSTLGPSSQAVRTVRGVGFRLDGGVELTGDRLAAAGDRREQEGQEGQQGQQGQEGQDREVGVGGGEPAAPAGVRRAS